MIVLGELSVGNLDKYFQIARELTQTYTECINEIDKINKPIEKGERLYADDFLLILSDLTWVNNC